MSRGATVNKTGCGHHHICVYTKAAERITSATAKANSSNFEKRHDFLPVAFVDFMGHRPHLKPYKHVGRSLSKKPLCPSVQVTQAGCTHILSQSNDKPG